MSTRIGSMFGRAWQAWDRFWFSPGDPLPFAVFRVCFGLTILCMYGLRHLDLDAHYTEAAVLSSAQALQVLPEFFRPAIELFPLVSAHPHLVHGAFLVAIVCLTLGVFGRLAALCALVLHLAFMQRNVSTVYGADIVNSFWLFFLCLGENDRVLSLRSLWRRKSAQAWWSAALTRMATRLVQIQLCVIYGYTGMEKLKGAPWWDGTAVWAVLANNQLMLADLSFLGNFPVVVGMLTHSALLFEVYFPILVWLRPWRKWVLAFGWMMHLGIAFGMGLFFFSGVMMSAYFVFISGDRLRVLGTQARQVMLKAQH